MIQDESVNEYFHKNFKLGQHVKPPEQDKIKQFLINLKPTITTSLINENFTDIGELINQIKMIENRKKKITDTHFKKIRKNRNKNGNNNNNINGEFNNDKTFDNINKFREKTFNNTNENPNKKFFSCSTKSSGGSNKGYDLETFSKKLETDAEKKKLIKAKKCGGCRKGGHRKNDEKNDKKVCLMQVKKLNIQIVETNNDFNSDFESEKT